jgi:DNA-directed RNA polymerase subunit beta'
MAVHVPLSAEAQAEARFLMLSANNLLKPQGGHLVTVPSQDMVLGSYYLTLLKEDAKGSGKVFGSMNEVLLALSDHIITIHAPIKLRVCREVNGKMVSGLIECTAGRLLFNEPIPQDLGFVDRTNPETALNLEISFVVNKREIGRIIEMAIKKHGFTKTADMLDRLKELGFKYSTQGAMTISVSDIVIPKEKKEFIKESEQRIADIEKQYKTGFITDDERYRLVIDEWKKTTDNVTSALESVMDRFNPLYMMADSGARGSMNQIRQLAGMRGLMANTSGRTIEIPIKANFREGLSVLEYFISSRGARKGLADTALRTADSGYLTRRLVDVSQDVIIRESDCGTDEGIEISEIRDGNQIIEPFKDRLGGRFLAEPAVDEKGNVIKDVDSLMTDFDARRIIDAGITKVKIRSVLKCKSRYGVCAKCYGANLATGESVNIGESVGIIAAQSIGEPGTQLTMRTFHTGGIAGDDITQGLPRVEELFEGRKPKKMAILSEISGVVSFDEIKKNAPRSIIVTNRETGEIRSYPVIFGSIVKVSEGDNVEIGDELTEGALNPHDVLRILGVAAVQNYLIQEVQRVYRQQGVDINDRHIEVIVRQMMRKVRVEDPGDTELLTGSMVDVFEFEDANSRIQKRIEEGETELKPATSSVMLLGITKASLATDSFLSAASFQETTRVLTEAAIKGKIDPLLGLKENVIIGKLIPAGSGMERYRDFEDKFEYGAYENETVVYTSES